ncbi:MAG: extensin-like protein [Rhodobacteraceae bacterium]|nr:extensin-like protein [Paracoccaceae bacterium]
MKYRGAYLLSLGLMMTAMTPSVAGPDQSLRPQERPFVVRFTSGGSAQAPATLAVRPILRPGSQQATRATIVPVAVMASAISTDLEPLSGSSPAVSLRPDLRPESVVQAGLFSRRKPPKKGSVCGDRYIRGEKVGAVSSSVRGCGISDAVRVTEVSGVRLSQGAVMNCQTAQALKDWVEKGVKPTFRRRGPIVEMRVAAHYVCRTRNHKAGAKISEHGKGNAIDISAFIMKDGEVITVAEGWKGSSTRSLLQKAHSRACGPFGTVLGPRADRYHLDHFHLDTARHRGGPYCR